MPYAGVGSLADERTRYTLLIADSLANGRAFIARPHRRPLLLALVLIGIVAVGLDAYTTTAMMASGLTDEGNVYAAHGMAWMGRDGYVAFASLQSLALVTFLLVKGRGLAAYALPIGAVVFVAWKLWTGVDNVLLWISLAS